MGKNDQVMTRMTTSRDNESTKNNTHTGTLRKGRTTDNCSILMQIKAQKQQMDPQFVSDSLLEASVRRHVPEHINYPSRRNNLSRNLSTSAGGRIFNRGQRRELHLNHSTE